MSTRVFILLALLLTPITSVACDEDPHPHPEPPPQAQPDANDEDTGDAEDAEDASGTGDVAPEVDADAPSAADAPDVALSPHCEGIYTMPAPVGDLEDDELIEASGLVASRLHEGVLYSHNDSGDEARLFAVGVDGAALGRLALEGVDAVDFEDIAAGACPGTQDPCLYVADIGNNLRLRTDLMIYVIKEPETTPLPGGASTTPLLAIPVAYPDGSHDAEALIVEPDGSALYIIVKNDSVDTVLYRAAGPFTDGVAPTLEPLVTFDSPGVPIPNGLSITAADLHPSGDRLAVRLYVASYEYRLEPGQTLANLDAITPIQIAAGPVSENQGESIAYSAFGRTLYTVSEARQGMTGPPLHFYDCPLE